MGEIIVPRALPVAALTWEVSEVLHGDQQATELISVPLPGPCRIVAAYPTVVVDGAPGSLVVPTADHIAVLLDINSQRRATSQIARNSSLASEGMQFVTLSALSADWRFLNLELPEAKPDLGIKFRWKSDVSGGAFAEDALVSLALFVEPMEAVR